MTTRLVNCTPHVLNVFDPTGSSITLIPCGIVPRVTTVDELVEELVTESVEDVLVSLFTQTTGTVEGLPQPEDDTLFIVSGMVRAACPDREDVASPGKHLRDSAGKPIGCVGLYVNN